MILINQWNKQIKKMEIDYNEDSNASSDYSLLGRMYKSKSLPGGEFNQDEEYYQVPGWDSGVGSDCFPGVDMDGGDIPGGEFASEGSGVMPSEEQNSGCTCDEQNQPDHVKVGHLMYEFNLQLLSECY